MKKLILGMFCLVALSAHADTNLPVICSQPNAAGQPISGSCSGAQTFDRATPSSLVRACASATCPYATARWQAFSDVPATSFVEVCTADKPLGSSVSGGECRGTSSSEWGAMAKVSPAKVAQATNGPTDPDSLPGTFTVSPQRGASPLTVTIQWDIPGVPDCMASGSWTGAKAAAGAQTVTNLTADASYTLSCTIPAVPGRAVLSWTRPTQNTDDSPLADLAGYRIVYGRTVGVWHETVDVPKPAVTTYTLDGLASGTWYFAIRAFTSSGTESALSNVVSKLVSSEASRTVSATRSVVIDKQPQPPVLSVADPTAFRLSLHNDGMALVRVGTVPLGTPCDPNQHALDVHLVERSAVQLSSGVPRPNVALARCAAEIER